MKRLLLIVLVLSLLVLSGCKEQEDKATPQSWAVKYAVEYFDEKYDSEVLINVYQFDYYWVDDNLTVAGWNVEDGYIGQAFKVEIHRFINGDSDIEIINIYVFLIWESDYTALDFISDVDGRTKPIKETQIVDVDILEQGE